MTSASSSLRESIIAGALLGIATGILTWSGLTALVWTRIPGALPGWARSRWARRLSVPAAAGEVLANAFVSSLPPRTDPPPLLGRTAMGATAGAVAGYGAGSTSGGAIAGAATAPLGAWVATTSRARLSKVVPDLVVAVAETFLAFWLARAASRLGRGRR